MYKKRKHKPSICSDIIKDKMKEQNICPKRMAYDLGISVEVVYQWCRGDTIPKLDMALNIADYLNISMNTLCGR